MCTSVLLCSLAVPVRAHICYHFANHPLYGWDLLQISREQAAEKLALAVQPSWWFILHAIFISEMLKVPPLFFFFNYFPVVIFSLGPRPVYH